MNCCNYIGERVPLALAPQSFKTLEKQRKTLYNNISIKRGRE